LPEPAGPSIAMVSLGMGDDYVSQSVIEFRAHSVLHSSEHSQDWLCY